MMHQPTGHEAEYVTKHGARHEVGHGVGHVSQHDLNIMLRMSMQMCLMVGTGNRHTIVFRNHNFIKCNLPSSIFPAQFSDPFLAQEFSDPQAYLTHPHLCSHYQRHPACSAVAQFPGNVLCSASPMPSYMPSPIPAPLSQPHFFYHLQLFIGPSEGKRPYSGFPLLLSKHFFSTF